MTAKIGPREQQLRALREAQVARAETERKADVAALREKVAAVPARKPKAAKKKRR